LGFIQRCLSRGELSEVRSRIATTEEGISAQTQIGDSCAIKPLSVGDIEHFPTELQCVTFPRQLERLVESHVEGNVSRRTQHVAVAHFSWSSWSEAAIRSNRIAEEVGLSRLRCRRLDRLNANAI